MLSVSQKAPDFTVQAHTGDKVRLSDHLDTTVVLWFYPRANTGGWTIEGIGFRDRIQKFEQAGVVVFGISNDGVEDNAAFAEQQGFTYPLLCDTSSEVCRAYDTCGDDKCSYSERITYVIGPDGRIALAFGDTAPGDHAGIVLDFLSKA